MKKSRKGMMARLFVGLILPAPLGTFLFFVIGKILDDPSLDKSFSYVVDLIQGFIGLALMGYFIFGIQSLIYTFIMEFIVMRNVQKLLPILIFSVTNLLRRSGHLNVRHTDMKILLPIIPIILIACDLHAASATKNLDATLQNIFERMQIDAEDSKLERERI